jgi:nicotinamide-nucleotide amidase
MLKTTIIAIGDELADGRVQDENSPFIARQFIPYGVVIRRMMIVPDDLEELKKALGAAVDKSDLVITTGGMGPTQVDLTRDAVCGVTGIETVIDPVALETVKGIFRDRGVSPIPDWAPRLARIPRGSLALINPCGLATGFIMRAGNASLACLPGEPDQVKCLWTESLEPDLVRRFSLTRNVLAHTLQAATGEPAAVKALADWIAGKVDPRVKVSIRPKPGVTAIDIRAEASDPAERAAAMEKALTDVRRRLSDAVFGEGDDLIEDALVRTLIERGLTIAVAESSTGGAIASRIVNVPGAGKAFLEGMVCYSDESKIARLAVPSDFFRMYGSVSESVSIAMATGIRILAGADVGLAVTGILGPTGGTPDKPIGTTWIACDVDGALTTSYMQIAGGRRTVKRWAARAAINFARLSILRSGGAF